MLSVARTKEIDFRWSKVSTFDKCNFKPLWDHAAAAVPCEAPVLLSALGTWRAAAQTSGQEDEDMLCQRAEWERDGSLRDLWVIKRRNRMLPGQLRDGGERGFPMYWRRDGGEHSTAASWAPTGLTKGKMRVEIDAVRHDWGCQGCDCHIPHAHPHICNGNPWPGDKHMLLPFPSTIEYCLSPLNPFLQSEIWPLRGSGFCKGLQVWGE